MGFIVNALPDYVKENADKLLYKIIFGASSIQRFTKQLGVKGKAAINLLNTTPVFQDGSDCGFTPQSDATFTQRIIDTNLVKVNMDFCHLALIGKYAEYQVRVKADQDTMPFEEEITSSIVDGIRNGMEKAVWQGDTASSDATLKHFDGLLKILDNAAGVVEVSLSGATAWAKLKEVLAKIPAHVLRKAGLKINVSPEFFTAFTQELVAANLFHYAGPQNANPLEFVLPGTNIPVVSVDGLSGTEKVVAAVDDNIYYGTDMEGDSEDIDLWFSKDNDKFRLKVRWNAGVQVAFPDEVVVGTIA